MAQMSLCDELLNQQQDIINSFIRWLEDEINQNSQQLQCFIEQGSSYLPKSILGQVEALTQKEQQNASKLQVLKKLNREATEIAEELHCKLEEARFNLTTPLISQAEVSEPEIYGGTRPKTTSWAKLTSAAPDALPQDAVASNYNGSHSELRQRLEEHVAHLRDEIFNVILGMLNMQCHTASNNRKTRSGSKLSDDEVFHLPQVHDTPGR